MPSHQNISCNNSPAVWLAGLNVHRRDPNPFSAVLLCATNVFRPETPPPYYPVHAQILQFNVSFGPFGDKFSQALAFCPVARLCRRRQVPLSSDSPKGPVDWVAGAAIMMKFDTLTEVRYFDSDFFLYFEKVDLMLRAARKDWQTW